MMAELKLFSDGNNSSSSRCQASKCSDTVFLQPSKRDQSGSPAAEQGALSL